MTYDTLPCCSATFPGGGWWGSPHERKIGGIEAQIGGSKPERRSRRDRRPLRAYLTTGVFQEYRAKCQLFSYNNVRNGLLTCYIHIVYKLWSISLRNTQVEACEQAETVVNKG